MRCMLMLTLIILISSKFLNRFHWSVFFSSGFFVFESLQDETKIYNPLNIMNSHRLRSMMKKKMMKCWLLHMKLRALFFYDDDDADDDDDDDDVILQKRFFFFLFIVQIIRFWYKVSDFSQLILNELNSSISFNYECTFNILWKQWIMKNRGKYLILNLGTWKQ